MAAGDVTLSTAENLVYCGLSGLAPNACMILPFGTLEKPEDLFPAQNYRNLELQLTGESEAGAIRVVTQQLRI